MEEQSSLASGMAAVGINADYDAACKRLLSEKVILAWILKSCAEEFREYDVSVIAERCIEGQPFVSQLPVRPDETVPVLRGLNTAQISPTEGNVFFDIFFSAAVPQSGETIELLINVEAQADFYPGYPLTKRGIFYCGRMISSQFGSVFEKSDYGKLRKVYSIWICTNPPKKRSNTINRYRMTEEHIAGEDREQVENYDLITLVMIHLGEKNGRNEAKILKLLRILLLSEMAAAEKKQILQEEFQIPMTRHLDREVSHMCNLSQGIEARGYQKGMQQGIQQGMRQGMQQGMQQGMEESVLSSVTALMRKTGWPFEKALSMLDIPEEQWKIYAARLRQ